MLDSLRKYRAAVDLSDMGYGKTYAACAVAKSLALPFLVVCPKIARSAWHSVAEHFDDTISTINYEQLRTGNTPYGTWEHPLPERFCEGTPKEDIRFTCQCCQQKVASDPAKMVPCYCHPRGIHCIVAHKVSWNYGKFRFAPQVRGVIFDEVQRCSGRDSLNAEMLIAAKRDGKIVLGLSATAACTPMQMRALGYVLGLHSLVPAGGLGFYDWLARNGCGKLAGVPGYRWTVGAPKQQAIMRTLHDQIIPSRGVRVRTRDIPNFPERTIICEEYDIECSDKVDAIYADMQAALQRWKTTADADIAPDSPLTSLLRARQRLEILKVPLAVELAQDYLDKGFSVAIFCNFSETVDALAERLNTNCIIDGRPQHNREGLRAARVASYQRNDDRAIVVNSKAGGIAIGLQDLDGEHPRAALVFPDFSAETMRQIFGRLPRDGGKSHSIYRVLFAAGTTERSIARALRAKSNNLDSLNDADMQPENFKLIRV